MLTRKEKGKILEELNDKLERKKIVIFTDFHGLKVAGIQMLRRLMKKSDSEYRVAKKTLLDRALIQSGLGLKTKELKGEIGVAFGYSDEVTPAKTLFKFSRKNETFKILGGILGNKILSSEEVITLAKLPGREVLIAKLLGTLQSPARNLVTILQGNIRNFITVLNKIQGLKSR